MGMNQMQIDNDKNLKENEIKEILQDYFELVNVDDVLKKDLYSLDQQLKVIKEFMRKDNKAKFDIQVENLKVVYEDAGVNLSDKGKLFCEECREMLQTSFWNKTIQTAAFSKKWAKTFHYDEDVSLISMFVYCKTTLRTDYESIKLLRQPNNGNYKYRIECTKKKNGIIIFSGDTMNSWATTLEKFLGEYGKDYFEGDVPRKGIALWEYLSNGKNYKYGKLKKPLPSYITDFLDVVYTIGNFIPVPFVETNKEFNRPRSSNSTKDYWDLALKVIYEWYKGDPERQRKDQILEKLVGKREGDIELCAQWLNLFSDWDDFVEKNYMKPFVDKNFGTPLELWYGHFYGEILPNEEWQFKQFFVNARERILARGWLIAEALINNAKKDVPDEKGNG